MLRAITTTIASMLLATALHAEPVPDTLQAVGYNGPTLASVLQQPGLSNADMTEDEEDGLFWIIRAQVGSEYTLTLAGLPTVYPDAPAHITMIVAEVSRTGQPDCYAPMSTDEVMTALYTRKLHDLQAMVPACQ